MDPTSRELLDLTVERVRSLPVLLDVTFHPEFQAPWIGQPQVTMLALNRLDRRDRTALVEQIAGGKPLPSEVVDQIADRTDGVPLFVEELTKDVRLDAGLELVKDRPDREVAFEVLEGSRCGTSATTTTFAARAAIVNAHHRHPMAAIWGDGTTSSSDGQYFRAGGRAGPGDAINAKYGIDPGAVLYTHGSGQYGPFHTKVLAATMSEAPYVLDGLHQHVHQTDLRIAEHYTDTSRRDRPRVWPLQFAGLPLRTPDQGPEGPQALRDREARDLPAARATDRRHGRNLGARQPMGGAHAP
jgi:Tn3 transposase DDE domain